MRRIIKIMMYNINRLLKLESSKLMILKLFIGQFHKKTISIVVYKISFGIIVQQISLKKL